MHSANVRAPIGLYQVRLHPSVIFQRVPWSLRARPVSILRSMSFFAPVDRPHLHQPFQTQRLHDTQRQHRDFPRMVCWTTCGTACCLMTTLVFMSSPPAVQASILMAVDLVINCSYKIVMVLSLFRMMVADEAQCERVCACAWRLRIRPARQIDDGIVPVFSLVTALTS